MDILKIIYNFFSCVENESIEIYNEFSLQHELGIYLRQNISNYKVQFERNTSFFNIFGTIKHEIDIVVFNSQEQIAIELKFPLNGQYPEQMFSFIKDIRFMEQLKENGFSKTYCITVVRDRLFFEGNRIDGIYSFFRNRNIITGTIAKPTGSKNEEIIINKEYSVLWQECGNNHFYIISI